MSRILVLFAHPLLEKSRVHTRMIKQLLHMENVTVRDLYQLYPDFFIDIKAEQELLLQHDIIVWQHPFYWYSIPPLLKQWIDLVLQHGWAYGKQGKMLVGKKIFNAFTTGAQAEAYTMEGGNHYMIKEFLRPLEQTARLCNMQYWPPFVIHGTHRLELAAIEKQAIQYGELIGALRNDSIPLTEIENKQYLNNLFPLSKTR